MENIIISHFKSYKKKMCKEISKNINVSGNDVMIISGWVVGYDMGIWQMILRIFSLIL